MSDNDSRRGAVLGLAVVLAIIVVVIFVVGRLRDSGRMQDCLASGRGNCAPLEATGR